jgi:beta-lactamase regulating signal transducer with metallopeptidase domain
MQTFLQSAFLQALGYAIANSLWQVAFLWLVVVLINNIGRLSSSKRYFVGVVAEFAAFIWFLCTLQFYYSRCRDALSEISSTAPISSDHAYVFEPTINNFSSAVLYFSVKGEQLLPYLSIAYLGMLFFLVIRLSRTFYLTQQIRKEGLQKPDVELRLFVKRTATYLGIKKEVKIYFSDFIKSPLTLGFLKPLILVPVASINHLTTDQLEALLLHELAHIKRADYLINILQSVIQTLLFFNPFVQLLGQLTKKERENSCDDWVLQFQYNPVMYAEALLRIACISAKCFAMNAAGNKNDLLSRVKRMLNQQEKSYSYRNQVFALMLITIMLSCAAWFNPSVKYNITANKASETHNIVIEPLSASVDNPLFSPIYFLSKPIQQELDKAINTANDKVEETASPVVAKTASNILTRVAPIALEKLQNLKIDIDTEVNEALVHAQNAYKAINELKSAPSLTIDTTNLVSAVKDVVINEINKTNWQQIGTDMQKVQADILSMDKDKSWSLVSSNQIVDAFKNTVLQLEGLKGNDFTFLKNSLHDINDKTRQKIEGSAKRLQEKIKEEKQRCRILNTYSDIQDDNAVLDQNMQNHFNQTSQNSEIYTPVQFNNLAYTYNVSDSINKQPRSAIIVVKHNPENDSNHIKNITVEIIGDNGEKKTYEFTVEVYQ